MTAQGFQQTFGKNLVRSPKLCLGGFEEMDNIMDNNRDKTKGQVMTDGKP